MKFCISPRPESGEVNNKPRMPTGRAVGELFKLNGIIMKKAAKYTEEKMMGSLHKQCLEWKSILLFLDKEIIFLEHLLHSYHFEPDTQELFERSQNYLERLDKAKIAKSDLKDQITKHETYLSDLLDSEGPRKASDFYQEHESIGEEVKKTLGDYRNLKSEIFNYAIEIMKKHKKQD